jgi:hypothetical protein
MPGSRFIVTLLSALLISTGVPAQQMGLPLPVL